MQSQKAVTAHTKSEQLLSSVFSMPMSSDVTNLSDVKKKYVLKKVGLYHICHHIDAGICDVIYETPSCQLPVLLICDVTYRHL